MKTTRPGKLILITHGNQPDCNRRCNYQVLLTFCLVLLSLVTVPAATQVWDGQTPLVGAYDGSGNWFTNGAGSNTNWWNGTSCDTGNWAGGSPDTAIIGSGSGAAGAYTINLDAVVSAASVTFTNPGSYALVGTNALTLTATSGNIVLVTNGVTATIAVPIKQSGATMLVGANAALNLGGGAGSIWNGNPIFQGINTNVSVLNITNGYYFSSSGTLRFDGLVANITNATVTGNNRVDIGRNNPGVLNLWNNGQLTSDPTGSANAGNNIDISRGQPAILNMYPGSLLSSGGNNSGPNGALYLSHDSASQATLNMYGGIANIGNNSNGVPGMANSLLQPVTFLGGANTYSANNLAIVNITGGIMTASALEFGLGSTYAGNPTNRFNMTGGTLYLDVGSISLAKSTGTNFGINLSGGIIGATTSWSPACSVPMTLGTANGNITFQTADANNDAMTMPISGALTGPGGLTKTGSGTLILSGANTYAGNTTVSNGTLTIVTSGSPTNGSVSLDGTAGGSPSDSVQIANVGQHWVINSLTYGTGSSTADFNYGSYTPSTTVAAILVNGTLTFTATPNVTVEGTAIPVGVYPLIKYTGTLAGTPPNTVTLPGYVSGYVTNLAASDTIALVVSTSTYNPALSWAVGNGLWNTTTANWTQFGGPVDYADPDAVLFSDTASGPSPITVTLNQTVNPSSVIINNTADNYIISGTGAMAGGNGMTLIKDGTASLTLSNASTYGGGTTVNNGTLNINYGGDGTGLNSAIGTGSLTINSGAAIDNTSGQALTLVPSIQQYWDGSFTFLGSTNFDLGTGQVTLGSGNVALTVNSNLLEVDGPIGDLTGSSILTKNGNGTLTLSNYNSFGGGVTLAAGTLDVNIDGALGTGKFTVQSGTMLDNTSGSSVALSENNEIAWVGSFTFLGTTNLDLGGSTMSIAQIMVTVSNNDLAVEGTISGANNALTKTGPGSLTLGGGSGSNGGLGLVIDQGTVYFNKQVGYNAFAGQLMTINTNGSLVILNPTTTEFGALSTVTLNDGTLDLNGDSELITTVDFNSGLFENSAPSTTSTLTSSTNIALGGTNCDFDVTTNSTLVIDAPISGTGTLVETDQGILNLGSTNTYSGITEINDGTLLLTEPGEITNSVMINIAGGATLDATARADQTLTLGSVETLIGNGSINGNLVALSGSIIAPGTASSVGTLTVTNNVTLGGNLLLSLNRTNAQTSSQLTTLGTITYGGTLSVTNLGPVLHAGDVFQLFPSAAAGFAVISLATTDANGQTYTWNNNVAADGSINVASVTSPVNPNPPVIQRSLSGRTLTLSWPTNAGWILQEQTNSLSVGLGTNWANVPGSSSVTSTNITINPASGSMFFRMVEP